MGRGKVVKAPDGGRWRVRRRWLDRPMPNLRKRFRPSEPTGEGVVDGLLSSPDVGDNWLSIGLAVAVLLIVFVLLPLLGVALEVIALIFVLCSGLVGRLVLGRPWIVDAAPLAGGGEPVKGWRRAGETADQLAREIEAAGRPERFVGPEAAT